jgi:hypothetical protein
MRSDQRPSPIGKLIGFLALKVFGCGLPGEFSGLDLLRSSGNSQPLLRNLELTVFCDNGLSRTVPLLLFEV